MTSPMVAPVGLGAFERRSTFVKPSLSIFSWVSESAKIGLSSVSMCLASVAGASLHCLD
jgi:hypothetical protein